MKGILRFLMIPAVIAFGAIAAFASKDAGYKSVTSEELKAMFSTHKDLVLIDSRGAKYMDDGTIIEGAKVLPADETTADSLGKLVASKDTPVVFYCSNTQCGASAAAAHIAHQAGYKNIYKLPGGLAEWKEKGLPTAKLN